MVTAHHKKINPLLTFGAFNPLFRFQDFYDGNKDECLKENMAKE